MKNSYQLAFAAAAAAMGLSLSACGDDVTKVNEIHQDGIAILEKGEALSSEVCDATKTGYLLFVTDSNEVFFCNGKSWQTTQGADGKDGTNGKDGADGVDGKDGTNGTNGKDGTNGINGTNGTDGVNGTSCTAKTVTDVAKKIEGFEITCGSVVDTLWNGADGKNGDDGDNGTSCIATVNQDGNFDLVCGGQMVGTIKNGADGKDGQNGNNGTSCTATVNQDGGFDLVCDGQTVGTIKNGEDGVGCTLNDNGNGSVVVTCGDDDPVTINKAVCGTKPYDPAKSFCSEGKLYSCDDEPYDPAKSFCSEGELFSCDDEPYDPAKSFCSEGELFSCNGKPYDPKKQYCLEVTRDGSDIYSVEALLTDARDEEHVQVYKTVEICNNETSTCQTWMAENLNYSVNPGTQSWCGGGSGATEGDCSVYGRLYTWAAAVGKSEDECGDGKTCNLPSGDIRGVCPEGWHLPSNVEWNALFTAVGGTSYAGQKLKADSDLWKWNEGTSNDDSFGFAVLPAGSRYYYGSFEGNDACFWSSTEYGSSNAYSWDFYYGNDYVYYDWYAKINGFSVRCLRDSN